MDDFFNPTAERIFKNAGITRDQAPEMFEEVKSILASKMARLSATMGLSYKRMELFTEQEVALTEDLRAFRETGHLR